MTLADLQAIAAFAVIWLGVSTIVALLLGRWLRMLDDSPDGPGSAVTTARAADGPPPSRPGALSETSFHEAHNAD